MHIRAKESPDVEPREVTIYEGFTVTVAVCPPKKEAEIRRRAFLKRGVYTPEGEETFARLYTREVVKGWKGLTLAILMGFLHVYPPDDDLPELQKVEAATGGLPYSPESAATLYRYAPEKFGGKIDEFLKDWGDENDTAELARKKDLLGSSIT